MPDKTETRLSKTEATIVALAKTIDDFVENQRETNSQLFKSVKDLTVAIEKANAPNWKQWGVYITIISIIGAALWYPQNDRLIEQKDRIEKLELRERATNKQLIRLEIRSSKCITQKEMEGWTKEGESTNSLTLTRHRSRARSTQQNITTPSKKK
jgi:hypothetical protein